MQICYPWPRRTVTLIAVVMGLTWKLPAALHGQSSITNNPTEAAQRSIRCPAPANPRKLYSECRYQPFDFIEETLTEDWAGLRSELRRLGITPTASYTTQLMGNATGGQSRGFAYSGTLQGSVLWELDHFIPIPGLSFSLGGAWSTGKSLSADHVGNSFAVQSAYSAPGNGTNNITLGEIYFQQRLFADALIIAAGRMAPASTFATMPVLSNYLNAGTNATPGALGANDVSFASYPPGVEWGVQAIYSITPRWQLAGGVFNTNESSALGGKGGLNFSVRQNNRGALTVFQINYLPHQVAEDTGFPGQYTLGGFYDSNRFSSLKDAGTSESGTYALYALFQQMIIPERDANSRRRLTFWGEVAIAPKASVNPVPYFIGGGLSYQGLVPARSDDVASIAVIYGSFSRYIPRASAETVLEANYQITLYRWLSITPDLQYVIKPGGKSGVRDALVLGTQLAINF